MKIKLLYSLIFIFLLTCKGKNQEKKPDQPVPPQSKEQTRFEKPQFVPLTPKDVDRFIAWASATGVNEKERVRSEISKMAADSTVADSLFVRYDRVAINDLSYSIVVLSIIGELKQPRNLSRFERIVWQRLPPHQRNLNEGLDSTDAIEMLASKAVEGIAWLKTPASDAAVIRVIREHNSQPIRSAAIDAYLFSKNDSEEAKQYLLRIAKKEDIPFIYRVRFKAAIDSKDTSFNLAMRQFYQRFPNEVAIAPGNPTEKPNADTTSPERPVNPPLRQSNQ